ncbi:DUF2523 family protein [Stenotrophomonas sp. NPDC077464]|uniref:DUF2523 family protein n=1 Tax=unclassified Stenotrophomonas TaxID=196198 RepID=UPI0037D43B1F
MPQLIGLLLTGLGWLFRSRIGLFVMTALAWLGINFGTIKMVIEPAIDLLRQHAQGLGGGGEMGAAAMAWAGVLQFDRGLTMIISAIAAKHAIMQGRLFLFKRGFGAKP